MSYMQPAAAAQPYTPPLHQFRLHSSQEEEPDHSSNPSHQHGTSEHQPTPYSHSLARNNGLYWNTGPHATASTNLTQSNPLYSSSDTRPSYRSNGTQAYHLNGSQPSYQMSGVQAYGNSQQPNGGQKSYGPSSTQTLNDSQPSSSGQYLQAPRQPGLAYGGPSSLPLSKQDSSFVAIDSFPSLHEHKTQSGKHDASFVAIDSFSSHPSHQPQSSKHDASFVPIDSLPSHMSTRVHQAQSSLAPIGESHVNYRSRTPNGLAREGQHHSNPSREQSFVEVAENQGGAPPSLLSRSPISASGQDSFVSYHSHAPKGLPSNAGSVSFVEQSARANIAADTASLPRATNYRGRSQSDDFTHTRYEERGGDNFLSHSLSSLQRPTAQQPVLRAGAGPPTGPHPSGDTSYKHEAGYSSLRSNLGGYPSRLASLGARRTREVNGQPQSLPARKFRDVELLRDERLGVGSYGTVYRAKCDRVLKCAAKVVHEGLLDQLEVTEPQLRFVRECEFLSSLRHPNVVQYLGTSRDPATNLPVLLMELMDGSLTQLLEKHQQGPLPFHTQVNICHDVALALSFLHSNDIIHRDLSSNNVLMIGDRRAKVTDFGMATLLRATRGVAGQYANCPGSTFYMPPEAALTDADRAEYDKSIDCFSFGVLALQVLTRRFPSPTDRTRTVYTAEYPSGCVEELSELQRRHDDIQRAEPGHPILLIAVNCLNNNASERPDANHLCARLEQVENEERYEDSQLDAAGGVSHEDEKRAWSAQMDLLREEAQRREAGLEDELNRLRVANMTLQESEATKEELEVLQRQLEDKAKLVGLVEQEKLSVRMEAEELRQQLRTVKAQHAADMQELIDTRVRESEQPPHSLVQVQGAWSISISDMAPQSATTHQYSSMNFELRDHSGELSSGEGITSLTAELKSQADSEMSVGAKVVAHYTATFVAKTRGWHDLNIHVNGVNLQPPFPLKVFVKHPLDQIKDVPIRTIRNVRGASCVAVHDGFLYSSDPATSSYHIVDLSSGNVLDTVVCTKTINGIAVDGSGNVYVTSDHRVQKYGANGNKLSVVGADASGTGDNRFHSPKGLTVHNDRVYVCDAVNARIMVFDTDLNLLTKFKMSTPINKVPKKFVLPQSPCDISFDEDHKAYVLDGEMKVIAIFKQGVCERILAVGDLASPTAILVRERTLLVTDWPGHIVAAYDMSGTLLRKIPFNGSPFGICRDRNGFVYVANSVDNSISMY